ncbi:phosphoribosylglycinamide formyltransferase [Vibrio cincinnatiensis]|uniref:phosphoribosylglycinamide formyltransferase n=1 Tax=Vibrio cincinnatiensis TaxID=675 RepID=UPI001EDD84FC|nr:phosphoribosylglycinamide formyltransferase [Vibrio cincinnatiensis]MCG3728513.1 phosphoribosylglycinamide formyltransferase [Vibrio cincinnatiensis]MCG3733515.1 phosphoribosylglycinamide formyltransferase [Vibrio cincinnatiensis]MCG3740845.1 phosphoribosylglycinamide formyltransferase [Vibrio cincinnatiensis]MCG3760777.1 phosphoribosylglycinamide formyltransferase [Vibrio cincinnatiensis]MCG3764089.1 phosphoribosylglycinamide formyltransferase [Vibrio cincinnatiensis]
MSLLLRTTALMLLTLSRAPAFAAAIPVINSSSQEPQGEYQNQINAQRFKHSLSGLYGIKTTYHTMIQPYNDFDVLYSKAHQAQHELETLCKSTAMLTSTQAHFSGVKSQQRAREKVTLELAGQAERITDLARATMIADDVPSLVEAYEALGREATIVKVKNRFKSPAPSGYRDLNVLVELPKTKIIAEVQFHLKAIADVKSGPEHALYEQIQQIERQANQEQRPLSLWESAQIKRFRTESFNLYQQAWLPYITTNIQAA